MQERKVILTWEAIYDVAEIAEYIEKNFGSARADAFEENIKKQMQAIGYLGGAFGNTHIYYHSYSIFMKPFPPSIVFYVIKEPECEIHILRVLREERNWKRILEERKNYTY